MSLRSKKRRARRRARAADAASRLLSLGGPRFVLTVEGGKLASESVERIRSAMERLQRSDSFHKVLILPAEDPRVRVRALSVDEDVL